MKRIRIQDLPEEAVSHNPRIRKQCILKAGEAGPVTQFARAVFPPGEEAGRHSHADITEIFTVVSGIGEIRINDVPYGLSEGVTVVVEPGEQHAVINTGQDELVLRYFGVLT
jgi:mannose-6-phosphate isomerase-like protein (cupin superfamily)